MKSISVVPIVLLAFAACAPESRTLTVLATNDVHGAWFDSTYAGGDTRPSLMAVNRYVDSIRRASGERNVLLLDVGDCLQGDDAAYFFNYVDTTEEHLFSRIAGYMKYDAICLGNHDIETGHAVYDKVNGELGRRGIPFMAGNAICKDGSRYFHYYKVFRKAGMKVLVLGYDNANISAWLDESLYSGMHFENLIPLVQEDVDELKAGLNPDVTIVCVHSGAGSGDGRVLEDQALDLYMTLHGVDLIFYAHDHRPRMAMQRDSIGLINSGCKAKYLGIGQVNLCKDGRKALSAGLIEIDKSKVDTAMRAYFRPDFLKVRNFIMTEIGYLSKDLYTRDAYKGPCAYMNLLHKIQLKSSGARLSFAAPLSYDEKIPAGLLRVNDLFSIYPYENRLCVMKLTGKEIKNYLEYSYSAWLDDPWTDNTFAIRHSDDPRNNQQGWSFLGATYNFDSCAGLDYTVDVTESMGNRVRILSLADGAAFKENETYTVAMTSYRASGAGGMLTHGAGIPRDQLKDRIISRGKEIRDCIRDYIESCKIVDESAMSGRELGSWRFIPDTEGIEKDFTLLFGE